MLHVCDWVVLTGLTATLKTQSYVSTYISSIGELELKCARWLKVSVHLSITIQRQTRFLFHSRKGGFLVSKADILLSGIVLGNFRVGRKQIKEGSIDGIGLEEI